MRRDRCILSVGFVGCAALLLSATAAESKSNDLLAVVNKSDSTLSLVDVSTGHTSAVIPTGKGPHEAIAGRDGKLVFVSDYVGVPGDRGHSITVVDAAAGKSLGPIELLPNRAPHGLALSKDGHWLWATCEVSKTVAKIDVNSRKLSASVSTGDAGVHMIVLVEKREKAYATSIDKGLVVVIDLRSEKDLKHLNTGAGAEGIAVTDDGKYVLVTNRQAGTLSAIDTASDEVVKTINVGEFPIRVQALPKSNFALVTNMNGDELAQIDLRQGTVTRRLSVGAKPIGIALNPKADLAFVANTAANKLTVVDLLRWKTAKEIQAGKEPDGMAYLRRD